MTGETPGDDVAASQRPIGAASSFLTQLFSIVVGVVCFFLTSARIL